MYQGFLNTQNGEINKELSWFSGYYRKFVPHFSKIAAPLHKLLKRDEKYVWEKSQDWNPTLGDYKRDNITVRIAKCGSVNNLGYSIEIYGESPGISYENKSVAVLYSVAWRTIVYVNLNNIDNVTLVLRQYVHHVDILCQMAVIRMCSLW
jgi:hypothetical protein